jgi:membrane fusion protein, copper/silver efflux system
MTVGHAPDQILPELPEGEEQPPPGVRTMAVVRWALVGLMALAAGGAWIEHLVTNRSEGESVGHRYLCPMHPQIVTDHKGECPICGMDLVPAASATLAAPAAPAAPATRRGATATEYTCPMHPEFVTTDPAARCPTCRMKLVPRDAPPASALAAPRGLAPVELTADRVQLIGMRTAPATRSALASSLRTSGYVAASEGALVSISARYSGWVESSAIAQTGQLVQKGDILAAIYSPEMVNAQQIFLNAIKWSDRSAAAAPGAAAVGPANDLERDARQRLEQLGVASEDVDVIAKTGQALKTMRVRAPTRGYVARRAILPGLFVQSGSEMFQIADLSSVWLVIDVPEADISRVHVGQAASFEVQAWPGQRFAGTIQFIYPALNSGSRSLQARIDLSNPGLKLRPGMYGDVTLTLDRGDGVVVPSEALVDTGEQQYVFVDRGGGRFEPRAVKAGQSGAGKVAILEGLAEGEVVVTTANFLLDSESRLRAAMEGFAGPAAPSRTEPAHGSPP